MSDGGERHRASCHCGAVVIEAVFPQGITGAKRCTCSFCRRRQAGNVTALSSSVRVLQGADNLSLYQWGTKTARHYFCSTCGIYTHHQRRSDPAETGVNLGCIEGAEVWRAEPMRWSENHDFPGDD